MLWRKMIRDIMSNKGSYLACLVLVLIGLAVFTAFSIASNNLSFSKESFYRDQNFAHGFIELESMPRSDVERLSSMEGIAQVSGRTVKEVRVHDPRRAEGVYLRLVSLDLEEARRVNDVLLLQGEALTPGELQAWVDNQFFAANRLRLNQGLDVIAGGRLHELTLVGVGMSPEFTYALRDFKEIYPDPERFGIAFLSQEDMERLFPETRGRVNDLVFTLEAGADFERVKNRLEPELEGYGLRTIYPREDQVSHLVLTEEITQIQNMSRALPMLFLLIAGVILYIMLKRLVEQQRGQIGILKAFGYTDTEITMHYLSYALVVGTVGGLAGGILGLWLAHSLTSLLLEFFNVPEVFEGISLYYLLLGLLLSLAVFLFSGYHGSKQALKLKPAEAMRPPAPPVMRKTLLERVGFFWGMLTIQGMMAVRNLSRNRGRTFFIFLGITISSAVVAMTWSMNEMIDKLVFYQFERIETYDAKMILNAPLDRSRVESELQHIPGVTRIEPLLEVPVSLSHRWRKEDVLLLGIHRESRLYNILDKDGSRVEPPENGIILSQRLAEKLGVSTGATLELDSPLLRFENDIHPVRVVQTIPQYLGMNAYMEISGVEEILAQGELATSFMLAFPQADPGMGTNDIKGSGGLADLRDRFRESEMVAGIDSGEERVKQARELMETFGSMIYIYVFIGVIICFAIIYSSSFIVLSERSRELASMMVLGMTPREVFSVISFEQWFVSIFALAAGMPLAQLMQWGLAREMSTDLYSLPAEVSGESLFMGLLITSLAIWLAQRFVFSRIEKLSLIEVLKTRE